MAKRQGGRITRRPTSAGTVNEQSAAPSMDQVQKMKGNTVSTIAETLDLLLTSDGAMAAAIVDSDSGMLLGEAGSGLDLAVAAAGNTEVVRAKLKTIKALGLDEEIEDILITLSSQYHIIRPMAGHPTVFLYLVLNKSKSNLALARINVKTADSGLKL